MVGLASAAAAPIGAALTTRLSPGALSRAFAVFLALVAVRLLWSPVLQGSAHQAPLWFDLGLGLAVGLLAGFMGVGGGVLAVPAFALMLGMPQATAQGTSLAVILIAAPAGAWQHARQGQVVWRWVPWLAAGAILGAPLASWLAIRLPHLVLARAFAVFLLLMALRTWRKARAATAAAAPAAL
jgi:uncharacterized membrane protein YfcA